MSAVPTAVSRGALVVEIGADVTWCIIGPLGELAIPSGTGTLPQGKRARLGSGDEVDAPQSRARRIGDAAARAVIPAAGGAFRDIC